MYNVRYAAGVNKVPLRFWNKFVPMEEGVFKQADQLSTMPFIYKHIAFMPDAHVGKGSTVGSVIATKGAIIPAAVGVDIGCGMTAINTGLPYEVFKHLNHEHIYNAVTRAVPVGTGGAHKLIQFGHYVDCLLPGAERIFENAPNLTSNKWMNQIGTLGSGNHFIEFCRDENDEVWIMIHSGSRGIGNNIGSYYMKEAQKLMSKYMIQLPDRDLAYLVEGDKVFEDYIFAVEWCQAYAEFNRIAMMNLVKSVVFEMIQSFDLNIKQYVDCHHNFVAKESHFGENVWITRKGAIRARKDGWGIIPGSMGERSFIVQGLGSVDSFQSCSHGAGRLMSRTAAAKQFTVEDHLADTIGVYCRSDNGILDETPKAYKNIDDVMASQTDLVVIRNVLKQFICVKG